MVKKKAERKTSKWWFLVIGILCMAITFMSLVWFFANYQITIATGGVPVETQAAIVREGIQKEVSPVIASDDRADDSDKDVDPPDWAVPLGDGTIIGYTYPLGMKGPWKQSVPESGFLLVALGNGTVDGVKASSDGTQGNVFLLVGFDADGSTPADLNETIVIDDYTLGHVQVTFIYAGNEDPQEAALSAVANMFGKETSNCGQEGCLEVTLHSRFLGDDWEKEVFTDPPN